MTDQSKDLQDLISLLRRLLGMEQQVVVPLPTPEPEPGPTSSSSAPQAKGYSLHIGLNTVSPAAYGGWDGRLNACIFDAEDMKDLIVAERWQHSESLHDGAATGQAVESRLRALSNKAKSGDSVLITYSGHGGQQPDKNGDESDGRDETWCLFDGEMIDDLIYAELCRFESGVNVFILSDSCHSGTVARDVPGFRGGKHLPDVIVRSLPGRLARFLTQRHLAGFRENSLKATVLLLSGCQDNQTSMDGPKNGAFTAALKAVWNGGKFQGDWSQFHKKIQSSLPSTQSPNLFVLGPDNGPVPIRKLRPFTI